MPLAIEITFGALVALGLFGAWVAHRAGRHEARAEAAFPPEGRVIEVDGHRVHGVIMGQGPDLVLIHGSSGNARDMTLTLAPMLAREFQVFVFDRPGLGYSDSINRTGASIAQQARLLAAAARQMGARRPIVLGHSYGGAVALAWAVHEPDFISALVAVSAVSNPWETGLSLYYRVASHPVLGPLAIPLLTAFVDDEHVEREVAAVFAPDPVPPGYLDHFGTGLTLRRKSLRANALQRANLLEGIEALHRRYGGISVPTEIVHGTADTTVGLAVHAEPLSRQIPGAVLTCLPGIGHMPHHAAPEAVADAVRRAAERAGLRPPG